jgi:LPXTG-motif cell wall-anchored protein
VAEEGLLALLGFLALMVLGVWHVFRKRGRIYI